VTEALKKLLTPAIGSVYIGPLDDPDAAGDQAVLFLYRVAVNGDLRNSTHVLPPAAPGQPQRQFDGSLPLDLYYLLTAGNAETGGEGPALATLGRAMQVLNGSPTLTGIDVRGETVRVTLDPVSTEEMSRIWTLFPAANYRTSVVYLATPVWIDPVAPTIAGSPVIEEPHLVGPIAPGVAP
jgi:hypothetical protein